ncbi:hypothetical protein HY29_06920 [Hyphomonas beringensis]|uniref:Uncharacterized protein n=1 Tax=Hyphomonas beringensis TaxID=1280946 RepID=A0A062TYC0_9PROT|nr:hypothetical protein HY29_06920 [Hyphomonas beringensis]
MKDKADMFRHVPCTLISVIAVICVSFWSACIRLVRLDMRAGFAFMLEAGVMARAYAFLPKRLKVAE